MRLATTAISRTRSGMGDRDREAAAIVTVWGTATGIANLRASMAIDKARQQRPPITETPNDDHLCQESWFSTLSRTRIHQQMNQTKLP